MLQPPKKFQSSERGILFGYNGLTSLKGMLRQSIEVLYPDGSYIFATKKTQERKKHYEKETDSNFTE